MKTLVVYYSYEGSSAWIADLIKESLNGDADLLRVEPENEKKTHSMLGKYWWGGRQVLSSKKPKLKPYSIDVNNYDLIIIGTPVWAWACPPAMAVFFSETKIEGKNIALFCCHGGGKGKIFEKMKTALPGNNFLDEVDFREPRKRPAGVKDKVDAWIKELLSKAG